MHKKILSLIFSLLIAFLVQATNNGCPEIRGRVTHKGSGVPYATVLIPGTSTGTTADHDGYWELKGLAAERVRLRFQSVGYESYEVDIDCRSAQSFLNIELNALRFGLDEVVVTASRYEMSRSEAPMIVNVLRSEQLQASGGVCLSDGLSLSPGLRVENNCQNCGFQQVRINGLEGPYSQILIDSRPVISALSGVYGIEQFPLNMIDRVEVVRGGGSALYGSNAIAGTINIITREPLQNQLNMNSTYSLINGEAADRNLGFHLTLVESEHKSGVSIFANKRKRDYWDANGDGFSELGLIDAGSAGMRSYYKTGKNSKITAVYHYIDEFRRGGNKFDFEPHETDITEQTDHKIHGGEVVFDLLKPNGQGKWSVYASGQHIRRKSYYGAGQDPNAYGNTRDLTLVGGTQVFRMYKINQSLPLNIVAGAEWQQNHMHDQMPGYNRDLQQHVRIAGIYGQAELRMKKFSILGGMRSDWHNLISSAILSPRFTLLVNPDGKTQWRSSFSTGFRAPQAFDEDLHIIAVNGGVMLIKLNPNLRPEFSQSLSTSLETNAKLGDVPVNAVVELFYTHLDDVFVLETIETDDNGNMIVERRNGSGARVLGVNLEQRLLVGPKTSLQAGFTWQTSRYEIPETWSEDPEAEKLKKLPKSPDVYGYANLTQDISGRLTAQLSSKFTGPMTVLHYAGYIPQDCLKTSPSFLELDLKLTYNLALPNQWLMKCHAGVRNLLNSFQKDFDLGMMRDAGYMYGPMKPRTFFAGLSISTSR
ncbi:MAG: TonB-dependent receptor [Bacteroidetes bacterium]|nr:TonB-dependent receptor [Bacteroidota bacterium]